MKRNVLTVFLAILAFGATSAWSQEKGKTDDAAKPAAPEKSITPLRIQVVFSEYDGDKKVGSLPYTLLVNADDRGAPAAMRMGLKVPVETIVNGGPKQSGWQSLNTNLDGRAERADDSHFVLRLGLERSSIYMTGSNEKPTYFGGNEVSTTQPVIQEFRTQVNLLIRDGQTVQSTVATDPVSGHVTKVDVTLNVIK
jgi:hypothetical protein